MLLTVINHLPPSNQTWFAGKFPHLLISWWFFHMCPLKPSLFESKVHHSPDFHMTFPLNPPFQQVGLRWLGKLWQRCQRGAGRHHSIAVLLRILGDVPKDIYIIYIQPIQSNPIQSMHYITWHYNTLHYNTLQYITVHYSNITIHYIPYHTNAHTH